MSFGDIVSKPKQLLGPNGLPINSSSFRPTNTKADPPKTGNAFGNWAGRDVTFATLPGGGVVQFDLSKLQVSDFRAMRDHYQVNASLSILSFMQHQSDFHVECEDKKIADGADAMLHENWTMLNRAMAQANWAGYSPAALEWDNNLNGRSVDLVKIKDLIPEECTVHWKLEEGWAPPGKIKPKFKTYDGINQAGVPGWPIPVPNSFWYPLLMENGDYYGRKLLRPAFQSWFFSILMHLFANRYYERFGEPTPIGRAPFDEMMMRPDGTEVAGNIWMLELLQQLRNRSVITLPNSRQQMKEGVFDYDYDIEYLESQMRGADFERYMNRLDEEVSIGLFTPVLMLRTADVGSYNLGQQHLGTYQVMLNSMNGDRKLYMDKYILSPWTDYNYSPNAPRPRIVFTKLGERNLDTMKAVLVQMVKDGTAKVDVIEMGQALGLTIEEIKQTLVPPSTGDAGTQSPPAGGTGGGAKQRAAAQHADSSAIMRTAAEIRTRIRGQVVNAMKQSKFERGLLLNMGFKNRFVKAIEADGFSEAERKADKFYTMMDHWLADVVALGSEFSDVNEFMGMFNRVLDNELARVA